MTAPLHRLAAKIAATMRQRYVARRADHARASNRLVTTRRDVSASADGFVRLGCVVVFLGRPVLPSLVPRSRARYSNSCPRIGIRCSTTSLRPWSRSFRSGFSGCHFPSIAPCFFCRVCSTSEFQCRRRPRAILLVLYPVATLSHYSDVNAASGGRRELRGACHAASRYSITFVRRPRDGFRLREWRAHLSSRATLGELDFHLDVVAGIHIFTPSGVSRYPSRPSSDVELRGSSEERVWTAAFSFSSKPRP